MLTKSRAAALLATLALTGAAVSPAQAAPEAAATQEVLFVGNNWEGTVDVLSPDEGLDKLGRINVIPDIRERMWEIRLNPVRLLYFLGVRALIGEGHDQFVDDMYSSPDADTLVVSRPSLADVVGIDMRTGELTWRFRVDGQRSDHMAVSPDGSQVAVSASTANVVHILDIETGAEVGRFDSGDSPHENVYSRDGELIFHASIGTVYTPLDRPWLDTTKGKRYFQVVDRDTNEVLRRIDMGKKLEEAGHPGMSSAVRPMTFSSDERFVYFQVSFFHGFVEYDLEEDRVTRVAELPIADHVKDLPREQYLLDSAHHGIAMNPQGTALCVAGTMSDYATIVSPRTFQHKELVTAGTKPYWATPSTDGRHCFVSWSGDDKVSAISYTTGEEVGSAAVGDHPQRMRLGSVPAGWTG
ncbi:PQQ-like domain-containing protein [Amycolatopsis marina]|uniref:PQQ-like domain-containing protein n=1 Tax=Amycolatopsis marina TaxID=490629 RepID=A0A1I0VW55_9PSEU|nr:PQQ-binding-like beta-propeller repeat protein [Amycolatopsis marina]SFA80534.1 PQQ-like domain-containing protein [Amycolatopsis marina]